MVGRLPRVGTTSLLINKKARHGGGLNCTYAQPSDSADNWRLHYKYLSLHDPVWANHLAYLPFPPNVRSVIQPFLYLLTNMLFQWPIFRPSGKLANWFETYASVLELNF